MLSTSDIQRLLDLRAETPSVVSLYLELDAGRQYLTQFRSLLADKTMKEARWDPCRKDLEKIAAFVEGFRPEGWRGLAVFSAQSAGLWQTVPLPEPVLSSLRLGASPALAPLLNILDQSRRFGVALLSLQEARFLEVHLGQVEELAREKPRSAPRTPNALQQRLKAAADDLLALKRRRGFDLVILAAPPELQPLLLNHLHTTLQDNLIVDAQMDLRMSAAEVLAKVTLGDKQSRVVRDSVLVYRLLDAVKSGEMGVAGLPATLSALNEGRVRMLLLREDLAKMGKACRHCGALSLTGKKCPYCWRDTEQVMNLVSEMAQSALDQNCQVFRIQHDKRLDALGGVGAELRFKDEAPAPKAAPPKALAAHPVTPDA